MTIRRGVSLVALCAVFAGCEKEAALPTGHFELRRATTGPLPLALAHDTSCIDFLAAGSIDIQSRHRFSSSYSLGNECPPHAATYKTMGVRNGTYTMMGDTAKMLDDAGKPGGLFYTRGRDTLYGVGDAWTLIYVRR